MKNNISLSGLLKQFYNLVTTESSEYDWYEEGNDFTYDLIDEIVWSEASDGKSENLDDGEEETDNCELVDVIKESVVNYIKEHGYKNATESALKKFAYEFSSMYYKNKYKK